MENQSKVAIINFIGKNSGIILRAFAEFQLFLTISSVPYEQGENFDGLKK